MDRLQKILSAAGVCSRRQAEEFLRNGRVSVNGVPASLGDRADPETDRITLDGRPVCLPAEKLYLMLHKPRGVVTTLSDEKGRPTVAALVWTRPPDSVSGTRWTRWTPLSNFSRDQAPRPR